jgi:hypothetical protein
VWPAKPKIFVTWLFAEKDYLPLILDLETSLKDRLIFGIVADGLMVVSVTSSVSLHRHCLHSQRRFVLVVWLSVRT